MVTHEQFAVEHKELKETEGRVEKILNHQINIEKLMEDMSHDMVTKAGVIAWLQDMRIRMKRNAVYQTKKVTCVRGGNKLCKKKKKKRTKKTTLFCPSSYNKPICVYTKNDMIQIGIEYESNMD